MLDSSIRSDHALANDGPQTYDEIMMNGTMNDGSMMWGMGSLLTVGLLGPNCLTLSRVQTTFTP